MTTSRACTFTKARRCRSVLPYKRQGLYTEDGVRLVEIVNRPRRWRSPTGWRDTELAFRISRFRPVRSTNIDVLLQMLEPVRVLEVLIDRSTPFPGISDANIGNQQGTDGSPRNGQGVWSRAPSKCSTDATTSSALAGLRTKVASAHSSSSCSLPEWTT
jgi:hypothetical protein